MTGGTAMDKFRVGETRRSGPEIVQRPVPERTRIECKNPEKQSACSRGKLARGVQPAASFMFFFTCCQGLQAIARYCTFRPPF